MQAAGDLLTQQYSAMGLSAGRERGACFRFTLPSAAT
jgi:hypothetical protein